MKQSCCVCIPPPFIPFPFFPLFYNNFATFRRRLLRVINGLMLLIGGRQSSAGGASGSDQFYFVSMAQWAKTLFWLPLVWNKCECEFNSITSSSRKGCVFFLTQICFFLCEIRSEQNNGIEGKSWSFCWSNALMDLIKSHNNVQMQMD